MGDHGAAVHLGGSAGHGEDGGHGYYGVADILAVFPVARPRVALAVGRHGDAFGAVDDGSATHSQNEVNVVLAHEPCALQQLAVTRVGVDARQFNHIFAAFFQCADYLVVKPHLLDGILAVNQQNVGPEGIKFLGQMIHGRFPEMYPRGILKCEIYIHILTFKKSLNFKL